MAPCTTQQDVLSAPDNTGLTVELDLAWMAEICGAAQARRGRAVQSVWGGYGEVFRVVLTGAEAASVVVKWVRVPVPSRSDKIDVSRARKCRSYDVEATWYRTLASRCDPTCRVPRMIDCRTAPGEWLFVFEDLDAAGFDSRRSVAAASDIDAGLSWLASFHACFLGIQPRGLWKSGTYWHLETRKDERASIEDAEIRRAAPLLDQRLRSGTFQTLVHGDAKLENFCFARSRGGVAAVDFQYVGGGCGMQDVAYFLSSCSPREMDTLKPAHLDTYFRHLREALGRCAVDVDADALEAEWRALYPIACADFYRFLAGWSPRQWRTEKQAQKIVREVIRTL